MLCVTYTTVRTPGLTCMCSHGTAGLSAPCMLIADTDGMDWQNVTQYLLQVRVYTHTVSAVECFRA